MRAKGRDLKDYGALPISFTNERDSDGNPIGRRADGAIVVYKLIDMQSGHDRHVANKHPTMAHGLLDNGGINRTQYDAATRFREEYDESGLRQRVGAEYSPVSGARGEPYITDRQETLQRKFRNAVRAMGPGFGDVVSATILEDIGLKLCEIPRLREGLNRLARHYGLHLEKKIDTNY